MEKKVKTRNAGNIQHIGCISGEKHMFQIRYISRLREIHILHQAKAELNFVSFLGICSIFCFHFRGRGTLLVLWWRRGVVCSSHCTTKVAAQEATMSVPDISSAQIVPVSVQSCKYLCSWPQLTGLLLISHLRI